MRAWSVEQAACLSKYVSLLVKNVRWISSPRGSSRAPFDEPLAASGEMAENQPVNFEIPTFESIQATAP